MSVKLIIYMVHDNKARDALREKVLALGPHVFELSGSTYAVHTDDSTQDVLARIKPARDPSGEFRLFVIEVLHEAEVSAHGDTMAGSYASWLNAVK